MKTILGSLFLLTSFLQADIAWHNDYHEAKKLVSKERPMMLMYTRPECMACEFMKSRVFVEEKVESYINRHFIPVEIDLDEEDAIEGFKVFGTPTFYFINQKGEKIGMMVGGAKADAFIERVSKFLPKK